MLAGAQSDVVGVLTTEIQRTGRIAVGRCSGSWHSRTLAEQPADVGANRMLGTHKIQGSAPFALLFEGCVWVVSDLLGLINLCL